MQPKKTLNHNFNLQKRTLKFSKRTLKLCKKLKKSTVNFNLIDQLIRSSTSIGANYIEANDALSKKDFIHRLRIARKEAKETIYWLKLIMDTNPKHQKELNNLIKEATELKKILSSIINKVTK